MNRIVPLLLTVALVSAACSSDDADEAAVVDTSSDQTEALDVEESTTDETTAQEATAEEATGDESSFQIEVWVDNWMAVYVDGELIGEDSVPITTERSFNAETFTFNAAYPFTVAIEAKDFKETDSGIEYIGEQNQQMGDGGIIAQVTDTTTGEVVAVTNGEWSALVVHRAPLNTDCERDSDPDSTCEFEITETPSDWAATTFDPSSWPTATEWSSDDVGPKDGYEEISWDVSAQLIWGTDLEVDNTVLLRTTVTK
jgi:hypothetical protein